MRKLMSLVAVACVSSLLGCCHDTCDTCRDICCGGHGAGLYGQAPCGGHVHAVPGAAVQPMPAPAPAPAAAPAPGR